MSWPHLNQLFKEKVALGVYNRFKEKTISLVEAGAKLLNYPSEAFKHSPIVFSMVANDQALEAIVEGDDGLLKGAYPGCIHVSLSTVAPTTTHKIMLKHQDKGAHFIAAPVFGRPDAAARFFASSTFSNM